MNNRQTKGKELNSQTLKLKYNDFMENVEILKTEKQGMTMSKETCSCKFNKLMKTITDENKRSVSLKLIMNKDESSFLKLNFR